ncbi:MAG: septum formation initiator family protein [Candidatus Omnitrophica bacterium]|nr:septum formation initiator family protein [Candidatus Omnitrophota bacterium]
MKKKKKILGWQQIIICIVGLATLVPVLSKYLSLHHKYVTEVKGIQSLKKNNKYFSRLIKEADTPYFVEKIAREQLGLMKKGEYLFKIITPKKNVSH